MVTYALTVGAAFGCVETLFFYARYGVAVAVSARQPASDTLAHACGPTRSRVHPSIHPSIHPRPCPPIHIAPSTHGLTYHPPPHPPTQTLRATMPLHIALGALTGCALAEDRFVRPGSYPWYKAIALPILLHGLFDLAIPLAARCPVLAVRALTYPVTVLLLATTAILARRWFLRLQKALPQQQPMDVHAQIRAGSLIPPSKGRVALVVAAAVVLCVGVIMFALPEILVAVMRASTTMP